MNPDFQNTAEMADKWKEDDSSTSLSSSPAAPVSSRRKFDDEGEDDDILDNWDAAEDSEVEREKARVAEERKAKAEAEILAKKKSKTERIAEKKAENTRRLAEKGADLHDEDLTSRRKRLEQAVQESDLNLAQDLFDGISHNKPKAPTTSVIEIESQDSNFTIDLFSLPLFNPKTMLEFEKLRNTLIPAISKNTNEPHYSNFLQEFTKQLAKELPSDQIKKIASTITTLSNEKMKEEKLAEKGGKKTKAAKTKVKLVASKNITSIPDVQAYDDDYGDDDFM